MPSRARLTRGRSIAYYPTAAEVTANGAGPWIGRITDVNANGTVDATVLAPNSGAVSAPLGAFTNPPTAPEMALLRTLVNQLLVRVGEVRKVNLVRGTKAGQYDFNTPIGV